MWQSAELVIELIGLNIDFNNEAGALAKDLIGVTFNIPKELTQALDRLLSDQQIEANQVDLRVSGAVVGSVSLSAGFIIRVLRARSLLGSLLASKPLCTTIDPLPIFWDKEQDSDRPL